jgi:S1-C subfamily serine protease
MSAAQILANAVRATGRLLSYDMSGAAVPLGVAVSLEPGTVITTCHGMAAGSKLVFRQGAETQSAELLIDDEVLDLCKVAVPALKPAPLAIAGDEPKAGDKVFALGVNSKGEFALTEGTVRKVVMAQSVKVLDLSIPIAPAASGGPVVDTFGRVVGIATTPHRYGSGVNAAISSAWISQMRSRARPQ